MITKDTHRVDWNKTAKVAGVVLLTLAKATWWLGKHAGLILVAILTVMAKVFVAVLSAWASTTNTSDSNDESDSIYTKPGEYGYNAEGELGYGGEHCYKKQ
ncbi:hypothetical protein D0C16_08220 [Cellvibrio sp. KY-GH-1]|jgi:hypothetical protein|uniref:hypothetical protein n=1 Tax=Cellvibrio sp. KY-GH-1 TaxID=2303332 RepID=UPI0012447755|nr:hypothetical protein [Cellvibrio sp. KY-GH-1]QEY15959.1 hypothetical protein D0C16_08220 [Cellvibrio sp. KY-GH-1]